MKKAQPKKKKVWAENYVFNLPAALYFNKAWINTLQLYYKSVLQLFMNFISFHFLTEFHPVQTAEKFIYYYTLRERVAVFKYLCLDQKVSILFF